MSIKAGKRKRPLLIALGVVLVLALAVGGVAYWKLFREVPQELKNDSMEEYFKYGSIGTEQNEGIPYWIWMTLPQVFPEHLPRPGGWASLGFVWEEGRELPVGFSQKTIGFRRVGINCALCHAGSVRTRSDAAPRIYLGAPATTADPLAYQRFLFRCASDPRFTAENILSEIDRIYELSWLDRMLYKYVLIPQTRKALLEQKEDYAWTRTRPEWGPGRIAPFNPVKVSLLGVDPGKTIGNSDMEPIWNLKPRVEKEMAFHWDGLNTDLREVFLSSALGDGARSSSLPIDKLDEMREWAMELDPPKFEELFTVDQELAQKGKPIYREHCARCHAFDGEQTGEVLELTRDAWAVDWDAGDATLYTDPRRAGMWTPEAAKAYNDYAAGRPWDFENFRATGGYVNVPLDGLWLRAPYLHNGSVPYLEEILEPPEERTERFYRGYDVYDPERMGFVSEGKEAERVGTLYDTRLPGNSNQGHLWGVQLSDSDKRALLEYFKTL